MSEHQQERQSVTPARADAGRSRWRSWFGSTGAPPAWGLVRYLICGPRRRSRVRPRLTRLQGHAPCSPTGKTPKDLAAVRVGSTLFGVVLLAVASLVVPDRVLFSLGVVILFAGIGLSPAYVIVGGALTSIGSILLAGAPTGDVAGWAGHRLLDTILGCAIALVATYLLWPRDREAKESVPVPAT
jgi:hypothetical protein